MSVVNSQEKTFLELRHSLTKIYSLVLFVAMLIGAQLHAGDPKTKITDARLVRSVFANPKPKIDGVVDECWLKAEEHSGFIQRTPGQGQPATTETKFYVLHDHNHIYLLFIMLDPNPGNIPARLVERDFRFYPDDSINFYLDTFNDQQRAYYFSTNPFGVEQDGLISNNGSKVEMTWDCVYQVEAKRNRFGWIAEFAIPFKSLRFDGRYDQQIWGFNAWRIRKENREVSYWSLVDQNYNMFRLDKGGVIIADGNIRSGHHIDLLPYGTARYVDPAAPNNEVEGKAGLDAQYGLTSDLTLNLTLNPDFGQVEIDEEQINLDKRFELSLEEKRPFFLENTNLFQLPISTFYSRRIGAESEIKGGVKLTGKTGPYSIGYVGSVTGDWENNGLGDPENEETDEVFNILRLQRDVLGNSNVGIMLTDLEENLGASSDNRGFNRSASLDWNLFLGRYQYFTGQVVRSSYQSDEERNGAASRVTLSHYDQKYWFYVDGFFYEPDFEVNGTGFFQKLPNKGHKDLGIYLEMHPFVNKRVLRSWGISSLQRIYRDSDESEDGYGIQNRLWFEFRDQSKITFSVTHYRDVESDYLSNFGFRSFTDLTYNGRDLSVEVSTDEGKVLSGKLTLSQESQYYFQIHKTGFSRRIRTSMLIKPISNWFFELNYENRQFLDDNGDFLPIERIGQNDIRIFSFRTRYLFTKNIFSRAFVQHTNGAEKDPFDIELIEPGVFAPRYTVFDRLSANVLLGWRYNPGSTIYLVYTEEWDNFASPDLTSRNRVFFFKFSYLWRL